MVLLADLHSSEDSLSESVVELINDVKNIIEGDARDTVDDIIPELETLYAYESLAPPSDRIAEILAKRRPDIILFGLDDRDLESEYDISDYFTDDPKTKVRTRHNLPTALSNLARAVDLDIENLFNAQKQDDRGKVRTILENAEKRLTALVQKSWKQSELSTSLELDGFRLQILIRSEQGEYVRVVERSDGLRQFVALLLFLARESSTDVPPILLIDEIEGQLHYDAQADLVQVLAAQELASKVIYTTYSIGCLPEDLGSGVRMVAIEEPHSIVENYFWNSDRPGFSPLLFSMGAATLAFLPMRHAVISEGAADLILLPALLKEAIGAKFLRFQVVPGLASATSGQIAILDNEAAGTAYLADCDSAGAGIKCKIREAGVPEEMILDLPPLNGAETVVEDYLAIECYLAAINKELSRSGCSEEITGRELQRPNRPQALKDWCDARNIGVPSKRAIAYHIVDNRYKHGVLDADCAEQLQDLHQAIMRALRI